MQPGLELPASLGLGSHPRPLYFLGDGGERVSDRGQAQSIGCLSQPMHRICFRLPELDPCRPTTSHVSVEYPAQHLSSEELNTLLALQFRLGAFL